MDNEKDEELDKLFRRGLEDPVNETAFRETDWDAMEQMLDKSKKRSAIVYWLPIIGSAAALVLIFLGYLFLKPDVVKPGKKDQIAVTHPAKPADNGKTGDQTKSNTGTSGEPARQAADSSKQQTAQNAVTPSAHHGRGPNSRSFLSLSSGKDRRHATGNTSIKPDNEQPVIANNIAHNKAAPGISNDKTLPVTTDDNGNQKGNVIANNNTKTNDKAQLGTADSKTQLGTADANANKTENIAANTKAPAASDKPVTTNGKTTLGIAEVNANKPGIAPNNVIKSAGSKKTGNRPVFALGVIASSDFNGVNSAFQQTRIGGNFGATFSVTFAKKWTISTGATYDIKPYLTNFDNYHTAYKFPTQPSSVNADCRMLDIPININYQVYHQRANSVTVGTGLSSYFMLREDYQFNYADSYATGPAHYTVINKNRNILSVLNLDVTYTHQINSKFGVTVQPYTKVPLSNVGYSQVKLQSTGVALGINWNINASSKPK